MNLVLADTRAVDIPVVQSDPEQTLAEDINENEALSLEVCVSEKSWPDQANAETTAVECGAFGQSF